MKLSKIYPFLKSPCGSVLKERAISSASQRLISNTAILLNEKESESDPKHPIRRTLKLITKDFGFISKFFEKKTKDQDPKVEDEFEDDYETRNEVPLEVFQTHCDVLVIGGGGVGSSIAYWLKKKARDGLNVVVVEKDITYSNASAVQSFHGLNQQFSLPENIQMAMYGAKFMRGVKEHLGDVNLNFTPYGSLKLATEEDAEVLKISSKTQNEIGVRNELLSKEKLALKFPWLNTEGIVLGCHGLENEGWFDPLAMLIGYKNKAREYGAHFVEGEVVDFEFQIQTDVLVEGEQSGYYEKLDKAVVRMPDGELRTIKFALCVIAAGSSSGDIGRLARIGTGTGLLSIPLPVEPRKRYSYICNSQGQANFSTPLTIDPNGTYFKREGLTGTYICGRSFSTPTIDNVDMEKNIFDTVIRPTLAHRINKFECEKVQESWTNIYEYNTFDENGIVGTHPYYNNLYVAVGFNGHGIQQTPAIGRGISELIIDGRFRTIDLTRLSFDRLIVDQPLYEISTA